ncbi:amidohydrolase [Serratia sp. SCBI]|nr:amidohydrolase [Serratia sp. SCBI]
MGLAPVVRYLLPRTDPHPFVLLDIIEKTLQRAKTPRPAQQTTVHPHRHHLRRLLALSVQHVEAVFQIGVKLLGGIKPLSGGETHVVGVQRVRNDQVRPTAAVAARHFAPERQIIAVIIAVIIKTALLHDQLPSVGAVAPGIPAGRRFAEQVGQHLHRFLHMLTLLSDIHMLIMDPAPTMADHIVFRRFDRRDNLRLARQRHRHAEDRQRQATPAELAVDPPKARPAAVFVQRIHRHMARRIAGGADNIGEKLFRSRIAMQHMILRTLLVIEHKLHGNPRVARPARVRRISGVASQVTGVILIDNDHSSSL